MKSTGILGRWPLNSENYDGTYFRDKSRNSNNGTPANTPVFGNDWLGRSNGITLFVADNSDSIEITGEILGPTFTFSFWAKWSNFGGRTDWIFANTDTGTKNRFYIYTATDSKFYYGWRYDDDGNNKYEYVDLTGVINNNQWHHIIIIVDSVGGTHKVYVDGVERDSAASTYTIGTIEYPSRIGRDVPGANHFDGGLADIRIYSYIFNPGQVANLYQSYGV